MERQVRVLDQMRTDHETFYQFLGDIDESTRERMELDHDQLRDLASAVRQKERQHYEEYQKELDAVKSKKATAELDINEKENQLSADRIYLAECVARVEEALSRKGSLRDAELEQIERESIAIETERERIKEDDEKLKALRAKVQVLVLLTMY